MTHQYLTGLGVSRPSFREALTPHPLPTIDWWCLHTARTNASLSHSGAALAVPLLYSSPALLRMVRDMTCNHGAGAPVHSGVGPEEAEPPTTSFGNCTSAGQNLHTIVA